MPLKSCLIPAFRYALLNVYRPLTLRNASDIWFEALFLRLREITHISYTGEIHWMRPQAHEHTHTCADNFYIVAIFQRLSDKLLFDCHKEPDRRTMAKANNISDGWVLKQSFTVNNLAEANSAHIHTHTHMCELCKKQHMRMRQQFFRANTMPQVCAPVWMYAYHEYVVLLEFACFLLPK